MYDEFEKKESLISKLIKSFSPLEKKRKRNELAIKQMELDKQNLELDKEYLAILEERKKIKTTSNQTKK